LIIAALAMSISLIQKRRNEYIVMSGRTLAVHDR